MSDLPIISECSGDMSLTQALQHFMVNSHKTMVAQVRTYWLSID